jgi:gamma-glutamyl hercynylcysteine S-oxide synthase
MDRLGIPDRRAFFRGMRAHSRRLFEGVLGEEAYFERPIALRHPLVFYEGHLPAFALNTLVKWALGEPGLDAELEALFERGIDPEEAAASGPVRAWPERARVQEFGRRADARVEEALAATGERADLAVGTILEHELMHQETFLYMVHQLPPERLRPQGPRPRLHPAAAAPRAVVRIPAGIATLGASPAELAFGWDNEFPRRRVEVSAFEIDALPVTNGEYLAFVEAGGYRTPRFWDEAGWAWRSEQALEAPIYWRGEGRWQWRALFEWVPLPLSWPVYVSHAEASAYCRFRRRRLPTEDEFHRAAYGTPEGRERAHPWGEEPPRPGHHGNFGFVSWDPWPVGSCPAGDSAFGVRELVGNGWEWTDSLFAPFPGFEPMPSYPLYSADFFDGRHVVLKGASPATARELVRRSFRNWYRPRYPYPYAKFRTVSA